MFVVSLALLRRVVDPRICAFASQTLKAGPVPASVHRLALSYAAGHVGVSTVIVKVIAPTWPDDPAGPHREWTCYTRLLPRLGLRLPRIYAGEVDPETARRVIVMEDFGAAYHFPAPTHRWTFAEAKCIVRAYARLHAAGQGVLPPKSARGWMWRLALREREWQAHEILCMIGELVTQGVWGPLPRVERMVEWTLAEALPFPDRSETLLHNDVYPPNIGLPHDLDADAVLLDWGMAGWGPAELDLAFLFLQPFGSAAGLDREQVLAAYWAERLAVEGFCPAASERQAAQRRAEALWLLSLVPVAHRVAAGQYSPGSAPWAFWQGMFRVLYGALERWQ